MRRPKLTGLVGRPPADPPVHRCACGCGGEASIGLPMDRWYVPGHQPAGPARSEPAPPAADLFAAARVFAPRRTGP